MVNIGRLMHFLLTAVCLPIAAASAVELGLPIACVPGEDCWIVRYADQDPGPAFADHRCGRLGSDAHDGTDFALGDPTRMRAGVDVLAAAAGTVRAVRDGMPDQPPDGRLQQAFGGMNCGNGVAIAHEGGWETQYCHLREGSVAVRPGDAVAAGDRLGLVGMSGEANFPHVHLTLRKDGQALDPFTGGPVGAGCGQAGTALWRPEVAARLDYEPVPIAVVGLTDRVPEHREILAGTATAPSLTAASPALVGYILTYGVAPGDQVGIRILGPDGSEVSRAEFPVEQPAPRASRSAGRKAPPGGWPAGTYAVEGYVRRGEARFARTARFEVGP